MNTSSDTIKHHPTHISTHTQHNHQYNHNNSITSNTLSHNHIIINIFIITISYNISIISLIHINYNITHNILSHNHIIINISITNISYHISLISLIHNNSNITQNIFTHNHISQPKTHYHIYLSRKYVTRDISIHNSHITQNILQYIITQPYYHITIT